MFFFQVPCLPEISMRSNDLYKLQAAFCGKTMGMKRGCLGQEDIEAYKYSFSNYGQIQIYISKHMHIKTYQLGKKAQLSYRLVW